MNPPQTSWPINKIKTDPHQPRQQRDAGDILALAENIKHAGIINPIEITPEGIIITGESRYRAAVQLKMKEVPVRVITEKHDRKLRQISENVVRSEMDAMDIARAVDEIRKRKKLTVKATARLLGRSEGWINPYLSLLKSSKSEQDDVRNGRITADNLLRVKRAPEKFRAYLKHIAITKKVPTKSIGEISSFLQSGGEIEVVKDLVEKKNLKTFELQKALHEHLTPLSSQIRRNSYPGSRIIAITHALTEAIVEGKKKGIAPIHLPRIAIALGELNTAITSTKLLYGAEKT